MNRSFVIKIVNRYFFNDNYSDDELTQFHILQIIGT